MSLWKGHFELDTFMEKMIMIFSLYCAETANLDQNIVITRRKGKEGEKFFRLFPLGGIFGWGTYMQK